MIFYYEYKPENTLKNWGINMTVYINEIIETNQTIQEIRTVYTMKS